MTAPSLDELIRADDTDAIAGFRDAHIQKVRRYCLQACQEQLREEACDAAFIDFLGRIAAAAGQKVDVEDVLLRATRAAAAGRFEVNVPPSVKKRAAPDAVCLAMPELLAAHANGELAGDEQAIRGHLERCLTCAATTDRIKRAERAFTHAVGWEEPQSSETAEPPAADVARAADPPAGDEARAAERQQPEGPARPQSDPQESESATAGPAPVRTRRGGLVGVTRRLVRQARDGSSSPGR